MVGVGRGGSQRNDTRVNFPSGFLDPYESLFGRGFTPEEIYGALPSSPGLFDRQQQPPQSQAQPPPQQTNAPPLTNFTQPPAGGQGQPPPQQTAPAPAAGGQPGQAPPQQTAPPVGGPRKLRLNDIAPLIQSAYADNKNPAAITNAITENMRQQGFDPNGEYTQEQLYGFIQNASRGLGSGATRFTQDVLPGLISGYVERLDAREGPPRGGVPQQQVGIDVQGGLNRLGFNNAPERFDVQQIRDPNAINGPTVQTQDVGVPRGSLDAFEKAAFESQYRPVERELTRAGSEQDRQLRAQLAQTGLSSSGSGMGLLGEQRNERQRVLAGAAQDAASKATVQRFGVEVENARINAAAENQNRLANAGFDFQAQAANADNILKGDVARSENYLKTMGLNVETANALREDYLKVLGLQQADLERLDASQRERVTLALNAWLQQFSALRGAGVVSSGSGSGGNNFNII